MSDRWGPDRESLGRDPAAPVTPTVEAEVRRQLVARLGGARAATESAVPVALFTVIFVVTRLLNWALLVSLAAVAVVLLIRAVRRDPLRPALQGAVGVALGALLASATGDPENLFLPGLLTNAGWTLLLGGSLLLRRPLAGYLVADVIGRREDWRQDPAIVRLGDRLTAIALAPMVLRLLVQVPLFLTGAVGWLGLARIALGWPLHLATLAAVAAVLARGRTPLHSRDRRDDQEGRA